MKFILPALCLCAALGTQAQNLRSGGLLKPEQAIMDIRHYTLALEVDPVSRSIDGYAEIDLRLSSSTNLLLLDLWHSLTVRQVEVNGKKEKFSHSRIDMLSITGTKPYAAGAIKIKETYGGKPGVAANPPWTGGFQWSKDERGLGGDHLSVGGSQNLCVSYYIFAQASKFVVPGSVRIASNVHDDLPNVAFVTPSGQKVLIVLNESDQQKEISIRFNDQIASTSLSAGAVATYIW